MIRGLRYGGDRREERNTAGHRKRGGSFNNLIRAQQQRRRDGEAEGFRGLEVDDELELRRLLDGEVAWLRALEDLVHVGSGLAGIGSHEWPKTPHGLKASKASRLAL